VSSVHQIEHLPVNFFERTSFPITHECAMVRDGSGFTLDYAFDFQSIPPF
jgi:hypothetical protein